MRERSSPIGVYPAAGSDGAVGQPLGDRMSDEEDLKSELDRLRAENEALKAKSQRALRLQVSAKGGVSLYGIRRFPITFYKDEWEIVLGMADEIRSYLEQHAGELKQKGA